MVSHRSLLTCSFLIEIITLVPKGMTRYRNSEVKSSSEDVLSSFMLPPHTSHSHSVQKWAQTQVKMLRSSEKENCKLTEDNTVKKRVCAELLN